MVIDVIQSGCETSLNGEVLQSHKHRECHNIIIFNPDNSNAQMHHVWDMANMGLSQEQKEGAEQFASENRTLHAVVFEGSQSLISDDAQGHLESLGIKFTQRISLSSGDKTWGVTYDPETTSAIVTDSAGKKLHQSLLCDKKTVHTEISKQSQASKLELEA